MKLRKSKKIWSIAIVSIALCGCQNQNIDESLVRAEDRSNVDTVRSDCSFNPEGRTKNIFDPSQLKVGDRFLGLTVTKIEASCQKIDNEGIYYGNAAFKGKIIVSGVYHPQYLSEGGFTEPCFEIGSSTDFQLPRMWGDRRIPAWFCFDNPEKAKQLLGAKNILLAKIAIDNYTIAHEPKGVINRGTIVEVLDKIEF
jgi:hypothetical protein